MADRVTPPPDWQIFGPRDAAPHPADILAAPDLASGCRVGYEQAMAYRAALRSVLAELAIAQAENARQRRTIIDLREALRRSARTSGRAA